MKQRAPRNRTLTCSNGELESLSSELLQLTEPVSPAFLSGRIVNQDLEQALPFLPTEFVDLLILDPPYNLTKNYNGHVIHSRDSGEYIA